MRARAKAAAGARAAAAARLGAWSVFICMRGRAPSGWAGPADFDCSAVLRPRGGFRWTRMPYSWTEGVREPKVREQSGPTAPREDLK